MHKNRIICKKMHYIPEKASKINIIFIVKP